MYKLIWIILGVVPVVLFLRAIFTTQSKKRSQAVAEFKKRVDYIVWAMLLLIGCGLVYSIASLILN
jgi:predicted cation transporter